MADAAIITVDQLPNLFNEINTSLREAPYDSDLIAPKIAWIRDGAMGLVTTFTLQLVSNALADGKVKPGEIAKSNLAEFAKFSCGFDEYDPPGYFMAARDLLGDFYGVMEPNLTGALSRANLILDQLLALAICSNPVTVYDGLNYFMATVTHPYNPNRPELGKFRNKWTGVALDRAGITRAADWHTSMRSYDGKIQRKPGKRYLVVATEDQESRARKHLNEGLIASDAGTASESTSLKGKYDDVLLFPELGDTTIGGNPKMWLSVKVAAENDRPFVVQAPERPYTYIDGLNPNDTTRVLKRGVQYGVRACVGAGFLYPQACVQYFEP